jgi:hypothetical protein
MSELTTSVLGEDTLQNQKDYLKTTHKPEKMSVKQWINWIKNYQLLPSFNGTRSMRFHHRSTH